MIPKHAKDLIDELYRLGYTPRGKEAKFMESVKSYIQSDRRLTQPMTDWLVGIYRKATGGGDWERRQYV